MKDQATWATLLTGTFDHSLYRFHLTTSKPLPQSHSSLAIYSASLSNKDSLSLWHYRLGHASFDVVK